MASNVDLAGYMIDYDLLADVAWWLFLNAYWNDEREAQYRQTCHDHSLHPKEELIQRSTSPAVPNELDGVIRVAQIIGRIEQAWGRSFFEITRDMYPALYHHHKDEDHAQFISKLTNLVYLTIMACIGCPESRHELTVSIRKMGKTPALSASLINIKNPMERQVCLLP